MTRQSFWSGRSKRRACLASAERPPRGLSEWTTAVLLSVTCRRRHSAPTAPPRAPFTHERGRLSATTQRRVRLRAFRCSSAARSINAGFKLRSSGSRVSHYTRMNWQGGKRFAPPRRPVPALTHHVGVHASQGSPEGRGAIACVEAGRVFRAASWQGCGRRARRPDRCYGDSRSAAAADSTPRACSFTDHCSRRGRVGEASTGRHSCSVVGSTAAAGSLPRCTPCRFITPTGSRSPGRRAAAELGASTAAARAQRGGAQLGRAWNSVRRGRVSTRARGARAARHRGARRRGGDLHAPSSARRRPLRAAGRSRAGSTP